MATIRIARRFRGPPDSGNGGYVAGLVAGELGSTDVSVTLHAPPPLDCDLQLTSDADCAWLKDGDSLIASADRHSPSIEVPPPPSTAGALEAQSRYIGAHRHAFPGCFVCGPERETGDGLRIFTGPTRDTLAQVAAIWEPDESLLDEDRAVRAEFLWSALDCPGYWSVAAQAGIAVLGRFAVTLHIRPLAAQPLLVTGWPIVSEGRKHRVGSALHDADGRLVAAAEGTWITLKP